MSVTTQERKALQLLADAWAAFCELPEEHPMEKAEFCTAIHSCQDKILMRSGRREVNGMPEPAPAPSPRVYGPRGQCKVHGCEDPATTPDGLCSGHFY